MIFQNIVCNNNIKLKDVRKWLAQKEIKRKIKISKIYETKLDDFSKFINSNSISCYRMIENTCKYSI